MSKDTRLAIVAFPLAFLPGLLTHAINNLFVYVILGLLASYWR